MPKEIYIDENGNERILSSSPSALSGLLDTSITTPSANQVLSYDGSKWGNSEIAESGSNTNGNYIKFIDGTMVCTKSVNLSVAQNEWSAWGQIYESVTKDLGSFPQTFYSTPIVNITNVGNAAYIERLSTVSTTALGNVAFSRPTIPGSTQNYSIQVIAIGRWKA